MSEWQPIETAPKDGTKVLFFCPLSHYAEMVIAWWNPNEWNADADTDGAFVAYLSVAGDFAHPTHWMPLPEPPKS